MERRFESRLDEMLGQAHVSVNLLRGVLPRLETFVQPFVEHLSAPEHRRHAAEYITGLMSKLERKTGEGIAYLLDQQRQGIQKFLLVTLFGEACDSRRGTPRPTSSVATRGGTASR